MQINDLIHGFQVKNITEVPEAESTFIEMEHLKTGAKLGWIKNSDDNKTFSITFKTVPEDHSGVFHILEHSVLQGSEKYPVKQPFVELIKGSMNTFLNAMTFPDKTSYPVCSRNDKDFENLVGVYMDAVFHPLLYKNENIFLQEGWHYESEEEGQTPAYNGVVLNEMRGANSSVDSLLFNHMQAALFPDNCYKYVSGGNPDAIVDLTYEKYKETHSRYYHPSNSFILLDGAVDFEKLSDFLDQCLSRFEKEECDFPIPMQKGTGPVKAEYAYAVEDDAEEYYEAEYAEDETADGGQTNDQEADCETAGPATENKGYLGLGYVTGTFADLKLGYATKILADYLADTNDSPLKKEILSRGLGNDISAQYIDGMLQPFLMFVVRNMDPAKREEVENTVCDVIRREKEKGLDKDQLDALLCQLEFSAKERDFGGYPTGLINCMTVMDSWLYGGDPVQNLSLESCFKELRKEILDGSFEKYIDQVFLANDHTAGVMMTPSATYLAEESEKEQKKLESIYSAMTEAEQKALWDKQLAMKEWQSLPNTEEDCKCLPTIELSDISEEPIAIDSKVLSDGTLWHHANTKGIRYLNIYLPLKDVSERELSELSFTATLFGELALTDTEKPILDMKRRRTLGNLSTYTDVNGTKDDPNHAYLSVGIGISYLKEKEEDAFALLKDILTKTDFGRFDSVLELLHQAKEYSEQALIMNGHSYAMMKARAGISQKSRYIDANEGNAFTAFIKEALAKCEEDPKTFCDRLAENAKRLFSADNMLVTMTSDGEETGYTEKVSKLLGIPAKPFCPAPAAGSDGVKDPITVAEDDHYISIPAPIAYAAMAGNLYAQELSTTAAWSVFSKLASMDYLWNKIRVLGGAYGAGMHIVNDGSVIYYTYRDPNPKASLEAMRQTAEHMEEFFATDPDLTRIIIGTISDTEQLLTPQSMGKTGDSFYMTGVTDEYRKKRRGQILHTNSKELKELACQLKKLNDRMNFAIVANQEVLDDCRGAK